MSLASQHLFRLGFRRALPSSSSSVARVPISYRSRSIVKPGFEFGRRRCKLPRHFPLSVAAIDESSTNITELLEESNGSCGGSSPSPNEGKGSSTYLCGTRDAATTVPVDQFASQNLARGRRRRRIGPGILINAGLITFASLFLLFFEWYSWQIVRLPLETFYLTRPFVISTILSACAGWLYVPIVDKMKIHQILRKEGPKTHYSKKGTPTMGGLFFVPIGVTVAQLIVGRSSFPVYAAAVATLAFAAIGLLDDLLSCVKGHNYGLSGWMKFSLQAAVGAWFSIWLDSTSITTPYHMKLLVPLPPPYGLVYLGKSYLILTAFCFAAMGNGVNLADGLDGLAGGVAALTFIGMSVSVIVICPELSVFGASMAGACIGFLFHNRYRASIFMGDTGSLALGGALAAMAACTGMFFPLFIASGVFVMEVLSVIIQVAFMKVTKRIYGDCRRIFRMAPLHHHFELCGLKEPIIVASAYALSLVLALLAGYIGLIIT